MYLTFSLDLGHDLLSAILLVGNNLERVIEILFLHELSQIAIVCIMCQSTSAVERKDERWSIERVTEGTNPFKGRWRHWRGWGGSE